MSRRAVDGDLQRRAPALLCITSGDERQHAGSGIRACSVLTRAARRRVTLSPCRGPATMLTGRRYDEGRRVLLEWVDGWADTNGR